MKSQVLPKILVVDDEAENLKALERTLRSEFEVVLCESPNHALELAKKHSFTAVLSDQRMPGMSGTDLLSEFAKLQPLATRIILTAFTDTKEILDAINRAEIYRYVTKPWDNNELITTLKQAARHHDLLASNQKLIEELESRNRELQNKERELRTLNQSLEKEVQQRTAELRLANEKLSEQAMTDPLTRLLNRRAMLAKLAEELERSKRYKHIIAVAMIDVDHFKSFNDMEGHVCGDEALRKVAAILSGNLRKIDSLCRYGGEEFFLIMPETTLKTGAEICERLRAAIEANSFQGREGTAYLTLSVGVASFPEHGQSAQELIQAADSALYQAKEFGRNRVVMNP